MSDNREFTVILVLMYEWYLNGKRKMERYELIAQMALVSFRSKLYDFL